MRSAAPRHLHHLAEYGAKADDGGKKAERAANPLFHGADHLEGIHPHQGANIEAGQQQGQKGVDLALHYGDHDKNDAT